MKVGVWVMLTAVICAALSGCGSSLIKPQGRITENGQPLKGNKGERLRVVFHKLTEGKQADDSFIADILPGSSFEVRGHQLKGIPPGKYRISVQITNRRGEHDRLKGAFSSDKSPILRDITSDKEEIIIDVAKPAG